MKEDLLRIINHYGVEHQQRKLNEEAFELQEAITDYRYVEVYKDSPAEKYHKEHITEEIADVLNVVEQFMYYYEIDFDEVIEIKHKKVHRQLERMEKGE